jgi:uncharacterized membrane protein
MFTRRIGSRAGVALILLALTLTLASPRMSGAQGGFTFKTIDFPGGTLTGVDDINDLGWIVGTYEDSAGSSHGFLLIKGLFIPINYPGATDTAAIGVNNLGQIVGTYSDDGFATDGHGFVKTLGIYKTIDPPDAGDYTDTWDINDLGHIVGAYTDADGVDRGFLFKHGRYTHIDYPGAWGSGAHGNNFCGEIVGEWTTDPTGNYFPDFSYLRDRNGNFTTIGPPGNIYNAALGINDRSEVVGVFDDPIGDSHGYLLSAGVYTTIDVPGATETELRGINNRRQIIGGYRDTTGRVHAFVGM